MLGEHLRVARAAELVEELRRALDVREEEGDGAARQLGHRLRAIVRRVTSRVSARTTRRRPGRRRRTSSRAHSVRRAGRARAGATPRAARRSSPADGPCAIAPPFTFTFSGSRPSSRMTARLCEANASFSSTRSRSAGSIPRRSRSLRTAGTGPMPITRGSTPATALPTNAPSGSIPSSFAFSSLARTSAAAPSLSPAALPAVIVPPCRNAAFSPASACAVVSGRGCSSTATSPTGTISASKRPARCAAAQRSWERSAKAS